ncbi:MAG: hypothetical protein Unbinned176contig1000_7 [Prokaryotic dsDNA virus sp.]|nr:MAG: hypothetical protein Unbinned176contig1000_7 [Prokaryotic dsDNA virus sp.]|tara:strand:+ start:5094 stop:5783 length:690 start_codon:yes stop_codon:yes gene_type:complete
MDIKKQILSALGLETEEITLEYQAKLEDGTIIVSSADALASGIDIAILTEDGSTMPLPVGEYKTEDGKSFSVTTEGTVAEIMEDETEEEEVEAGKEDDKKKYEETEVAEAITDEVTQATDEIATAIDEATGDEVTPEVAEAAAEIAVAIVEEKIEDVAMNKHLKELTEVLKEELSSLKTRLNEIEKSAGGEKVRVSKFNKEKKEEVSYADYSKMGARERFYANLSKIKN